MLLLPEGSSIGSVEKSFSEGSQKANLCKNPQGNYEAIKKHRLWEKNWWKKLHKLCLKCSKECKQSAQVKIIACPQFTAEKKQCQE